ncbi:MAG: D-glycerate dehydrogenase [Alphaproteobacteria bacterium]|nr:D-glycerate dehydrogenase [Alphaproteobacteria bacterium]
MKGPLSPPGCPLKKPLVIVTRKLPDIVETRMRELFDTRLNPDDRAMTQAELIEAMKHAEVLVPTVTDRLDSRALVQAGPNLKLIANFGAGVDHIDVETARQRGVIVTNTPGVLTEDTADMTMALILAVPRRMVEGAEVLMKGNFKGWSPTWMLGKRIWGKRLGIIGMGRIGQAVARRAKAFGLQIHYHNRKPVPAAIEQELEATYWESLDQMLARVDIVSVNCPHTPATYHLLSARRLKAMKPSAYIVNTARGEVIDENALARMLEAGELAGAGLDVFEHEPAVNPKLLKLKNVVLLPHMGSATLESRIDMGEKVIVNIKTYADGHRPPDRVIPAML